MKWTNPNNLFSLEKDSLPFLHFPTGQTEQTIEEISKPNHTKTNQHEKKKKTYKSLSFSSIFSAPKHRKRTPKKSNQNLTYWRSGGLDTSLGGDDSCGSGVYSLDAVIHASHPRFTIRIQLFQFPKKTKLCFLEQQQQLLRRLDFPASEKTVGFPARFENIEFSFWSGKTKFKKKKNREIEREHETVTTLTAII